MRRLLRSVINIEEHGKPTTPTKIINENLLLLGKWKLQPTGLVQSKLLAQIHDHHALYAEPPSLAGLEAHYENENEEEVLDFLKALKDTKVLTGSNFESHLRKVFQAQQDDFAMSVFNEAREIISTPTEFRDPVSRRKIIKHGLQDAISHVYDAMGRLTMAESGVKLSGDSIADAQDVVDSYYQAKNDPNHGWGRLTGIEEIDLACRGLKPGEMWTHCASTGHLKTTFALNWAWRQAVQYRWNVIYFSLEMKKEQLDRRIFVLHSAHPKFAAAGFSPLPYSKVRDGELQPEQEVFLEMVKQDLLQGAASGEYGEIHVECPIEEVDVPSIQRFSEAKHREDPIGMVIIDRADLVKSRFNNRGMTEAQNWVFRDLHAMALNFNRGESIPVLLLAQMNREGLEFANANDGHYTVKHIAWANEAERSSDVISYSYLKPRGMTTDEQVEAVKLSGGDPDAYLNDWKCGCLKNRDNPIFNQFTGYIDWDSRMMTSARMKTTTDFAAIASEAKGYFTMK